jgi:hypothetical protein
MMKKWLILFFGLMMAWMLGVTVWASLSENVMVGFDYLFANRWGIATLCDTYFSFTIIFLWMAYKESSWGARLIWLILVYCLGSIAVSAFVFREIYRLSKIDSSRQNFIEQLLCKTK